VALVQDGWTPSTLTQSIPLRPTLILFSHERLDFANDPLPWWFLLFLLLLLFSPIALTLSIGHSWNALNLKPGIDCARLPREAMLVAVPRKVYTILPHAAEQTLSRANLACVEPNRSGSLSRGKVISVCCALSVETALSLRNSVDQQPRAAAALRCWTRTR
jgi:hypothetical protein